MSDPAEAPRTEASALAWARSQVPTPDLLTRHRHPAYDSDPISGGFAFTTPDRLVMVGRHRTLSVQVLAATDDVDTLVDEWLGAERHRNRELADDDLGPWQRAALRLLEQEVEPGDVRTRLSRDFEADLDIDAATYLWIELRRARTRGVDPRRVLAGNDSLLDGPGLPPAVMIVACPVCRAPVATSKRYPRAVCDDCYDRTTCVHGRRVHGFNVSLSGGFAAEHADGGDPVACEETTHTGACQIGDVPCHIGEAHFGGVVVQTR